jgi:hypothetical protein
MWAASWRTSASSSLIRCKDWSAMSGDRRPISPSACAAFSPTSP